MWPRVSRGGGIFAPRPATLEDYKQLEGKAVEVDEIRPAAEAYPIIEDALGRYSEQRREGFDRKD